MRKSPVFRNGSRHRGLRVCRAALAIAALAIVVQARAESLVRPGGQALTGTLTNGPGAQAAFQPAAGGPTAPLEAGAVVSFEGSKPAATAGLPPFRVDLGIGQRISGRLRSVDASTIRIDQAPSGAGVAIARVGAASIVQRPGEIQVLHDDFETLEQGRWSQVGDPELSADTHVLGQHSLRLTATGSAVTCKLADPIGSGRFEVSYLDDGSVVAGEQCFVELLFRASSGPAPVRAIIGWSDEMLGVESVRGPTLAVQHLLRKKGWHRLSVRFGGEHTELAVDGDELAFGTGPDGPLTEIRVATFTKAKPDNPPKLAIHFDDLSLVKLSEPVGSLEIDPSQDEVRLSHGDQVFGTLRSADENSVKLRAIDTDVTLPWSEVSGVFLRRKAVMGRPIDGLLVRAEWRAAAGDDPADLDQVEGALVSVSGTVLTVATPYAGTLAIPRDRLRRLHILGRGTRLVIDPTAHHLGNEICASNPFIDPPVREGGVLERTFELATVPAEPAAVVLDVIQVVGEADGLRFADEVQKGWLRTSVKVNGQVIDYVNRHIRTSNDTRERVRLAIPPGLLKPGTNALRLEQKGRETKPDDFDDLGVLAIAIEFGTVPSGERTDVKP
jgi:hypothetical protein